MSDTERTITVEDLQEKALRVRDIAQAEVRHLSHDRAARVAIVGAVALIAALAIAYHMGARSHEPLE
jgi:hypothetical protein